ncbi:Histidine decarboxylase proenzyme [subsurface metagenome]
MTIEAVVNGAVGPFDSYCDGYGNPGATGLGYISVLTLETGTVASDMDEVLEEIVSYDRAEARGTYIGQINMITASSFNGMNGAVWGYHIVKADSIANNTLKPLFMKKRSDGREGRACREKTRCAASLDTIRVGESHWFISFKGRVY